jgi:DNA-directed RNA polymerase subunit F
MMIGKKVIDTKPITISEAREILMKKVEQKADENNEVDGHQFTYEQNLTIDYVNKFALLDAEDAKELVSKLEEYLTTVQAVKVVDLMPEDLDDLRLIFAKERGTFDTETLQNVLDLLDQYR